jgi:small ligand-binding sensory domain FIST
MRRCGSAIAGDPDASNAARRAAVEALAATGAERAAAALLFAVGGSVDLAASAAAACDVLGTRAVASARGHGVLAGASEDETGPAVAVLALTGADGLAFHVAGPGAEDAIGAEVEARLGRSPTENDLVVVFADPLASEATRLVAALADLQPATAVAVGAALGAGDQPVLASADRAVRGGLCGLVLALDAPARVAVSQGCRPITDPICVTRVEGNWILELDGKPALDVYREIAREPLAADLRRAAEHVFAALPRRARHRSDPGATWVARRVAGFAPARRAFALPEPLRVGTVLRFALRDADLAREDLSLALNSVGGPASAGLYLSSSARGRALFQHSGLEAAIVARALAPAPIAGLFGSFEIAPLAGSPELLAHAGVLITLPC